MSDDMNVVVRIIVGVPLVILACIKLDVKNVADKRSVLTDFPVLGESAMLFARVGLKLLMLTLEVGFVLDGIRELSASARDTVVMPIDEELPETSRESVPSLISLVPVRSCANVW
jgi:hypothetical protein